MAVVSIIVPVWNAARWLDACVGSVLSQSFFDFELLLLDDGSTDGSDRLCDLWAEKDSRIRVLHKEDTGPADTRNLGLSLASGRYIAFLDSDDEYLPGFLESAVTAMEEKDCQIVSQGYTCQFTDHSYDLFSPAFFCACRQELWPHFISYYHEHGQFSALWNKMYRADFLKEHQIRFDPELYNGEDILFNFQAFAHLERFQVLERPGYRYWTRGTSLSHRVGLDYLAFGEKVIGWSKAFFEQTDAPSSLAAEFEQRQLLTTVTGYYSALTDSSKGYSLSQRIARLRVIFRTPRYRAVLLPWLKDQRGIQYSYLRFAAALGSPVLSALPVALKSRLKGTHHA